MRKLILLFLLIAGGSSAQNNREAFEYLRQLDGVWQKAEKDTIIEYWTTLNDTLLSGAGIILNGEDTLVTERLSIYLSAGRIIYSANVSNQNEGRTILFELTSFNSNGAGFKNERHDFPNAIYYHIDNDLLNVTVTGHIDSSEKVYKYRFLKIK